MATEAQESRIRKSMKLKYRIKILLYRWQKLLWGIKQERIKKEEYRKTKRRLEKRIVAILVDKRPYFYVERCEANITMQILEDFGVKYTYRGVLPESTEWRFEITF